MNNFLEPYNFGLWVIVVTFWAAVMMLSRFRRGRVPVALLIVPTFFLLVGTLINRVHFPWGTYAVGAIHVMMLPAPLRVAKSRP
jgi:hypothetical protein